MNLFELYKANGDRAGFIVQRRSWARCFAEVVMVDGRMSGALEGEPPFWSRGIVLAHMYMLPVLVREDFDQYTEDRRQGNVSKWFALADPADKEDGIPSRMPTPGSQKCWKLVAWAVDRLGEPLGTKGIEAGGLVAAAPV